MNAKLPAKQLFHALSLILITILLLSSTGQSVEARPLHLEFDCSQQAEIPEAECDALVALYNSTDGANWTDNTGWLQTNTPCSWYGVGCDNVNIVSISLYGNNLMGSIPSELGGLENIDYLDLSANLLNSSIPSQLGDLASLSELYLSLNQLSGSIPPELGNLTNLSHLGLIGNQLSGSIPPELGNLDNLSSLGLDGNQLTGLIPPELGNLVSLSDLGLHRNQLSGSIPPEIGNLSSLSSLNLGENQLSGSIPPELGDLANLSYLYLNGNQLSGSIPPELGNLTNLSTLWLGENQLSDSIPPGLGNLANLSDLDMSYNQLSGSIPPELGNLTNLSYLYLGENQLNGSIPPEIGNLSSLSSLDLHRNQLSGLIPPELGDLANLSNLGLGENQLSDSIPPDLGNLTNLSSLWLGGNQLSGSIPPELGNLSNLYYLGLNENQLSSSIPPELGDLENLSGLWLGGNQLSGSIPPELGDLTNLYYLLLDSNQLTGLIPPELGNLINLEYLYLHNNLLSGEIPHSITNLEHLYEFSFDTCGELTSTDPDVVTFLDNISPGWSDCYSDLLVTGQDVWIFNGSTYTRAYNYTSFGNRLLNWPRIFEYKIDNIGDTPINLNGTPKVEINGSPAFSVYYQPAQDGMLIETIPPGEDAEFGIWFKPTTVGVHTATVSISNNSADKNPYTFTIQGVGVWDDPYEKDNDFSTAKTIVAGTAQTRALYPGSRDKDYVKFTLTRPFGITLETTGEWGYDTEIALYDENYNLIGYDNDGGEFLYSKLTRTCNANPLPAGTYYAMVYNYEGVVPQYQLHFDTVDCPPTVISITRTDDNPTAAANVDFTVTFSEPVTNVDVADFNLATSGVTGATITEVNGSGAEYTVTVNTGTGSGTIRLDVLTSADITDLAENPLAGLPYEGGETYNIQKSVVFQSIAAQDGWILESGETTNKGGTLNKGASTLNVGDDAANKQYRAVLSFNTALPAGAVITKATLRFKYAGKTGTLPFSTHGKLLVDVKNGAFGNNPALAKGDFNAGANKNGLFSLGKSTGWFSKVFSAGQLNYINTSGVTQFRLRFAKDDNDNFTADLLKIHSGNAGAANRPQLIIEYYVP